MTADSFKLNCEDAIAANLDDTTLDPKETGYIALTIAEMREIHDALRTALETDDRTAEQSRNESLRVQRLVERVKELEGALSEGRAEHDAHVVGLNHQLNAMQKRVTELEAQNRDLREQIAEITTGEKGGVR